MPWSAHTAPHRHVAGVMRVRAERYCGMRSSCGPNVMVVTRVVSTATQQISVIDLTGSCDPSKGRTGSRISKSPRCLDSTAGG
jgi:hypothetical protein